MRELTKDKEFNQKVKILVKLQKRQKANLDKKGDIDYNLEIEIANLEKEIDLLTL